VLAIAGDVYGVVARYIASLAGIGPSDHQGFDRLACLAFSAGSLPFQFTPALVALVSKIKERLKVVEVRDLLAQRPFPGMTDFRVEQAD
jgi:hypothetical protein